ncbi:MAG: glycosyltransferase family 39 protein, partial [Candidatus Omnitrophica bacterium]|nr:glycosyltransferase family 39 protein [Candidatus Omnitrophota bacterium]
MRATFKKIDLSIVLLVGLTVSIAVTNFFWLSMNQRPPVDDEAGHLVSALKYLHVLGSPERNWVWLSVLDHFYPPLFPFLTALAAYWTGIKGVLPFVMGNVFFMALTFFSLYGIGHKLGDRKIGLLASCLISLYPMFFHMSRMFMLEIPLVGMVSLTMLLLLYTKGFSRTLWSFGAGIAMGLGLLTKQLFPVFLPGPLLYFFLNAGGGVVRHSLKRKGLNLCLFLATGILIALPWYWRDGAVKFNQLATMVTQPIVAGPLEFPLISVPSLTFYLKTLAQDQMGWFFCSAFVFFLILNFRKMLALPFLLIWFTVPYVILTLLPNKFYYYTLPCLPAAALITAWGLLSLKHLVVRRGLIAFVLVWGAFHYGVLSFMSPQIHSRVLHGARYSPIQKDYHVRTLIRRITEESPVLRPTVGAFTIDPNVFFAQTGVHLGENYVLSNLITLNTVASLESK